MNFFASKEANVFAQIQQKSQLINNHSSILAVQKLVEILSVTFPNSRTSPLSQLYEEAVLTQKEKWIHKMRAAISVLSPNNLFGSALLNNKDVRVNFENQNLTTDQQSTLSQKQIALSINLKTEGSINTLPLLQNFFVNALLCLVNQRNIQHQHKWQQSFRNDEYYFHLVRNPILHILRQWLNHSRMSPFIFNRILKVAEVVLIRQPIIRLRKTDKKILINNCHLYGVQALSEWRLSPSLWQLVLLLGQSLQQKTRNGTVLFQGWVRLWTGLMLRGSTYEEYLLLNAQNGIERGEPLSMVRYASAQQFQKGMNIINGDSRNRYIDHLIRQAVSVLAGDQWIASAEFLQSLITLLLFIDAYDSQVIVRDFKIVGSVLAKMQAIFREQAAKSAVQQAITIYTSLGGKIQSDTHSKPQNKQRERTSGSGRKNLDVSIKKGLISRQEIRDLNQWKRPILSGQSHILFLLFRWLSGRIDRLRGIAPAEYPRTNLRFLTTSWVFLGLVLLIVLIVRLLI